MDDFRKPSVIPAKLAIAHSHSKDEHLINLLVNPNESDRYQYIGRGILSGLSLSKNERCLEGLAGFDGENYTFTFAVKTPQKTTRRPKDYDRLAAIAMASIWHDKQRIKETREKLAWMFGYSELRGLNMAIKRARKIKFFENPCYIRSEITTENKGFVIIADKSTLEIVEHSDWVEVNGIGWCWVYGDKRAKYGKFSLRNK